MTIVLATERLLLRHLTIADAPFILRLLNEPSFLQNIGDRGVRNLEQASRYLIDGPLRSYRERGHGLYAVVGKESPEPLGICGLVKREELPQIDLGYALLPEFWSKGFAHESAAAVVGHARETMRLRTLLAIVSPRNAASIRLLEKLDFRFSRSVRVRADEPEISLYELRL